MRAAQRHPLMPHLAAWCCFFSWAVATHERIMYVQLKTGHDTDAGPAWIARVNFTRTWRTAYVHGRTLRRVTETARANFEDAREADEAFLQGAPLPGRASG